MAPLIAPATARRAERPRVVIACALASAAVGAAGVVFLVGMFVAFAVGARSQGKALGAINDSLVLVSYALIVPAIVVLRDRVRAVAPLAVDLATVAGLAAVAAIVVLQALLIRGVLTFEEQIGMVTIAFLVFDGCAGGHRLGRGTIGAAAGRCPNGSPRSDLRRLPGLGPVGRPATCRRCDHRRDRLARRLNHPSAGGAHVLLDRAPPHRGSVRLRPLPRRVRLDGHASCAGSGIGPGSGRCSRCRPPASAERTSACSCS